MRRNLVGSLKSLFRITAACEQNNLRVELRLACLVGGNEQRVGLLLGGEQRGEVSLQRLFGGEGIGEEGGKQEKSGREKTAQEAGTHLSDGLNVVGWRQIANQ